MLLIAHFFIQYACIKDYDLSDELGWLDFATDLISHIVLVAVVGSVLGLLVAIVPYKRMAFGQKFKYLLPVGCSLVLMILIPAFGYTAYLERVKGIKLTPVLYEEVRLRPHVDCSSVRDGSFEIGTLIIDRIGRTQRQTNKDSGLVDEYRVEWLSDCEYVLTPLAEGHKTIKVKIMSVSEDGYYCYVASGKYGHAYEVKRTKGVN